MYKLLDTIEIGTTEIVANSLIIMKTESLEGGTAVPATDDFDAFINQMEFSHTAEEIDTATTMTLDSQLTKLGWVDILSSKLSCNESTRTISVGFNDGYTSSHLYINGTKLIMDTPSEITFSDNSNVFYVIMSESKTLSVVSTIDYNDYSVMPICFARWNNINHTLSALFDLRVHNLLMDVPTRSYIFSNGTQWQKGFEISNFAPTTTTPEDVCRFDISGGQIRQSEKLITYIDSDNPTLAYENNMSPFHSKVYYINGTSYVNNQVSDTPLYKETTFPYYNKNTSGTWSLEEVPDGKYFPMIVGVSTDIRGGASDIAMMGQEVYDSYEDCVNNQRIDNSMFADLEVRNFRFLYMVVYHVSTDYVNNYSSKAIGYVDIRKSSMIPVVTGASGSGGTELKKVDVSTSATITANSNTEYYLKTGSNGAIINLPSINITAQDQVVIEDIDGILSTSSNVSIVGLINGLTNTLILNVPYTTTVFEWSGTTWIAKLSGTLVQPIYQDTLKLTISTGTKASMNIPIGGVVPTSPNDGDIFTSGNELCWKRTGFGFVQTLSTPTGTYTQRTSLSGLGAGYKFFQTDGVSGLYRYMSLADGWSYEGDSNWMSYNPTIGSLAGTAPTLPTTKVLKGLYKVSGKTLHIKFMLYGGTASGTLGTGVYTISLPSGYTIDTTLLTIPTGTLASVSNNSSGVDGMVAGIASWSSGYSNSSTPAKVVAVSDSKLSVYFENFDGANDASTLWGAGFSYLNVSNFSLGFIAELPIVSV